MMRKNLFRLVSSALAVAMVITTVGCGKKPSTVNNITTPADVTSADSTDEVTQETTTRRPEIVTYTDVDPNELVSYYQQVTETDADGKLINIEDLVVWEQGGTTSYIEPTTEAATTEQAGYETSEEETQSSETTTTEAYENETTKREETTTSHREEQTTTVRPSEGVTQGTTERPTQRPSEQATTVAPTQAPTQRPTEAPTTVAPTQAPTQKPTQAPTEAPTQKPTQAPTEAPTAPALVWGVNDAFTKAGWTFSYDWSGWAGKKDLVNVEFYNDDWYISVVNDGNFDGVYGDWGICISEYSGNGADEIVIPGEICGIPVTRLNHTFLNGHKVIRRIVIPASVEWMNQLMGDTRTEELYIERGSKLTFAYDKCLYSNADSNLKVYCEQRVKDAVLAANDYMENEYIAARTEWHIYQ